MQSYCDTCDYEESCKDCQIGNPCEKCNKYNGKTKDGMNVCTSKCACWVKAQNIVVEQFSYIQK